MRLMMIMTQEYIVEPNSHMLVLVGLNARWQNTYVICAPLPRKPPARR